VGRTAGRQPWLDRATGPDGLEADRTFVVSIGGRSVALRVGAEARTRRSAARALPAAS